MNYCNSTSMGRLSNKQIGSTELGGVKNTKIVVWAQFNMVHTHESKCAAFEAKVKHAKIKMEKDNEALEDAINKQKERHTNALKQLKRTSQGCKKEKKR